MDNRTKKKRSYNMSRIMSKNTKPEITLRKFMRILNFVYQPKGIVGKPDFANRKEKIAVFVDGCFWHKCPKHYIRPKTNTEFWDNKVKRNKKRDAEVDSKLKKEGWKIIRIWEHDVKLLYKHLRKL